MGSAYGSYLRRKKRWIGHVFAGRYKSLCVEKEGYLLELSRYIHLNPVRAGLAAKAAAYKWSSYGYYIGEKGKPGWLNTDWLLAEYGQEKKAAWKKYKGFVESAIENPSKYPKEDIVGQALLGSKEFTRKVIKGIKSGGKSDEITAKRRYEGKIDLEEIRDAICKYYKVKEMRNIDSSERHRGRLMFIYLAKEQTSAFNREIAEMVGEVSPSGVTHQYRRILKRLEADRGLLKEWEKELKSIMSVINRLLKNSPPTRAPLL